MLFLLNRAFFKFGIFANFFFLLVKILLLFSEIHFIKTPKTIKISYITVNLYKDCLNNFSAFSCQFVTVLIAQEPRLTK